MTDTYSVWMQIPATGGFSRIAGSLNKADAERLADALLFPGRAMPDTADDYEYPIGRPTSA